MAFVYVTTFKMPIRHFKNITTTNVIVWCFEQELPLFVCILIGMKTANFMLMLDEHYKTFHKIGAWCCDVPLPFLVWQSSC